MRLFIGLLFILTLFTGPAPAGAQLYVRDVTYWCIVGLDDQNQTIVHWCYRTLSRHQGKQDL
jgi:hypothetical protein